MLIQEGGAGVDAARLDGTTSLMGASSLGHWEVVRELCMRGAHVDASRASDGFTPLILASISGACGRDPGAVCWGGWRELPRK